MPGALRVPSLRPTWPGRSARRFQAVKLLMKLQLNRVRTCVHIQPHIDQTPHRPNPLSLLLCKLYGAQSPSLLLNRNLLRLISRGSQVKGKV